MKRLVIFATIFLIPLALLTRVAAQRNETFSVLPFSPASYRVGERLTYNVSYSSFISAAHVELLLAGQGTYFNRDGYQIRAHVETTEVVNAALYAVNNDYFAYVDPSSGLPFHTQQVVREAGRAADTSREYNEPVGTSAIPPKSRSGEITGNYDLVSALYRVRALPLVEGSRYRFNVSMDVDRYDVELKVTGHELIKTNVGSFNAVATQSRVLGKSAASNLRIRAYFSDDERHVPVLIVIQPPVGEIRAELVGSELLKKPSPTPNATPPKIATLPAPAATPPRRTAIPTSPNEAGASDHPSNGSPLPEGLPFKVGEQLNYNVFLGTAAQPVGTGSFQVRAKGRYFNHDGLLLSGIAQTNPAMQKVFVASDQVNSYVDDSTLLPFRTEMNLLEGRRRASQMFTIDQDRGNAITEKGARIDIPVGTHDFVSVVYALRSFNLSPPRRNAVSLMVHNRPRTLFITSLSRDIIQLGGQSIPAIQVSLTTDDPQSDKYALRLWVSEDKRRLPLRLTAKTALGPVRADLAIVPLDEE